MIVGKSGTTEDEVFEHSGSYEQLIAFSDSLIPEEWRHVQAIVGNQRYVCALLLRKCRRVKWEKKKPIIERILSECSIVGYSDTLYDAKSIWAELNVDKVQEYYERSLVGDVKPRRKSRRFGSDSC